MYKSISLVNIFLLLSITVTACTGAVTPLPEVGTPIPAEIPTDSIEVTEEPLYLNLIWHQQEFYII